MRTAHDSLTGSQRPEVRDARRVRAGIIVAAMSLRTP